MAPSDLPSTKKLDELYQQAKSSKRMFEPEWLMNLAFFNGRQWLKLAQGMLQQPSLDPTRITVTENRIAGVVRTELAKMTKNRPVFVVTPQTGDEEDANASDVGERLMRFLWKHLGMHELSLKALEWSRVCCAGFLKCYWDSSVGDPIDVLVGPDGQVIADPQSGKPMMGDQQAADMISRQLGAEVKSKRIAQGDVRVEVRSPFQMFIDPICDSFQEAEWLIEESVKSLEYAKQRYGSKAQGLKADTPANPGLVEARMVGGTAGQTNTYMGVKIREYWCKPNSEYPNGCRTVWSQEKILAHDENPFDPMPYVMLTGIPTPGRLWPLAPVDLLRGPQTELNKTLSQMAENRNRIGNPTLVYSKQAMTDLEKFLDGVMIPGGTYGFDETGSQHPIPQYLDAPPLPEYVTELPDQQRRSMEDLSGQHEVTNAQVPPGVTAASAITLLQEADDTRLGLAIQDYEVQIGRLGSKLLALVAKFYTDARTIKIAGEDGAWEIFDFKGQDLRGNTRVDVQAGSAFPQNLAVKQAMIKDMMTFFVQSGNPPHGRQLAQFLRDVGMGASDRLVQEYTQSEAQINRENMLLTLGEQLQIHEYDDHEAHVEGHQEYARGARFQSLSPQQQQPLLQHLGQHQQQLDQQQQQQLQTELMMAGKVPPNTTQAAFQEEQQLSQLHGVQQDQQQGAAQAQQQLFGTAQQQGLQQAQAEQQQRHAEEKHQHSQGSLAQQQRHEIEAHQQRLQHQQELHEARLAQVRNQARQGGGNGR